jgi:hypothetical protein
MQDVSIRSNNRMNFMGYLSASPFFSGIAGHQICQINAKIEQLE